MKQDYLFSIKEKLALSLPNTEKGKMWIEQFEETEQENAIRLLGALTLVSHSAFERDLQSQIISVARTIAGPVALYATRELEKNEDYFEGVTSCDGATMDAVARGADLGSEARIAAIIRNVCKTDPDKLLNHPSLETLRKNESRAKAIIVIDDIIGSGTRTAKFINAMWCSKSVRSWHSRHQIKFIALAYTATLTGTKLVESLKCGPIVSVVRNCPTLNDIPWEEGTGDKIKALCKKYGRFTSRRGMSLGFKDTMSTLVFEHGCPNNSPSILWAPISDKSTWKSLFPDRAVCIGVASAFPSDIMARDPIVTMSELCGGEDAELPPAILGGSPLGSITIMVLSLAAAGVRSHTALSYATGYNAKVCSLHLSHCVERGYLTATLRLTSAGRAELNEHTAPWERIKWVPNLGEDAYYPQTLRWPH